MKKGRQIVRIPHLGYKIVFRWGYKTVISFLDENNMNACHIDYDKCTSEIWLREKPNLKNGFSSLAHEILHALQFIAEKRHIDMVKEKEHFAYLMQYILNEVLGYKYE